MARKSKTASRQRKKPGRKAAKCCPECGCSPCACKGGGKKSVRCR